MKINSVDESKTSEACYYGHDSSCKLVLEKPNGFH